LSTRVRCRNVGGRALSNAVAPLARCTRCAYAVASISLPARSAEASRRLSIHAPAASIRSDPTVFHAYELVRRAVTAWLDDFAPSMGAALSYYTVFSIAPLLVIVIAIAGVFFGRDAAHAQLFSELSSLVGTPAAESVEAIVRSAQDTGRGGWTAILGVLFMVIGATTVLAELQSSLDRIWRTPADTQSGWWTMLRTRLLSFSMILGLVFLLMVSLVVSSFLTAMGRWGTTRVDHWGTILQGFNLAVGYVVTAVLFAMIYKLLPRERIGWRDVWMGSIVTAALFTAGKFGIALYIGKAGIANAYGAAGSLVVLLVWVYYSAQIFLLGAEFTWVYAYAHGSRKGLTPPKPVVRVRRTPAPPPEAQ
jgi:membrane protein